MEAQYRWVPNQANDSCSGRSDWLWLDDRGRTTTWINNRGSGQGMIPRWAEIGQTHDMDIDRSIVDDRRAVQFGRIFGDNGVADVSSILFPVLRTCGEG